MSSVINPIGPEEPSVYWRRRAIVLVALLVVLWAVWMLARGLFGGDSGSGDGAGAEPGATSSAGSSASPDPSGSAGSSADPSGVAKCGDGDISVTATAAAGTTQVGKGLALSMTVTNTSKAPCSRDVGAGANELRVTSGDVLVWSSDFCNPSDDADVETLEPGAPWTTNIEWPGTITPEGCPSDQRDAQPGAYNVIGRNGPVDSEPVPFTVE